MKKDVCLTCSKEMERSRSCRKKKYCDSKCYGMSREKSINSLPDIHCIVCEKKSTYYKSRSLAMNAIRKKRVYCSDYCKAIYVREISSKTMAKTNRIYASERMKKNNPMSNPESIKKMMETNKGRTFLSRGGNGQNTKQQIILSEALKLPMEYPIPVSKVKHLFESLPSCYKVDLAFPELKLAIEVDGSSHNTKKWKFLDKRKTSVLNALGWTVLRFTNKEVDNDLNGCLQITESIISTLKTI